MATQQQPNLNPFDTNPYQVGNILTLRRTVKNKNSPSPNGNDETELVRVKIKRLHQPWTLSSVMVVDILPKDDAPSSSSEPQIAFLKLYDWRFATSLRDDHEMGTWNYDLANQYASFATKAGADKVDAYCRQLERGDDDDDDDNEEEDDDEESKWSLGRYEFYLAHEETKMYRSETEVYERLEPLQGDTVPKLIGAVELDATPAEINVDGELQDRWGLFRIKGLLLEHIPDCFTLRHVDEHVAEEEDLQRVVDKAVGIARSLGDYGVLNGDVRVDNFFDHQEASEPTKDGETEDYRVVMIDFGQSRVRREDESDLDWGRAKYRQDEEGAAGMVIRKMLEGVARRFLTPRSERWDEFAEREEDEDE